MAFTTFSGPVRAGTQRYGDVTTMNTGLPVLSQSATVPPGPLTLSAAVAVNLFTLPAGSKILRFRIEKTATITGATSIATTFGNAASATAYMTNVAVTVVAAQMAAATLDAALVSSATNNIGTSDVTIVGTFTAAGGSAAGGSLVVTVEYIQRAADGSQAPVNP
jgi:phage baseplate assembly protein gpV